MLYSNSLFAFREQFIFDTFCSVVPYQHLAKIRHLHIEVMCREYWAQTNGRGCPLHPPPDFQEETEWIQFWNSVGRIPDLKTLEVNVTLPPAFWIGARVKREDLPAATRDSDMDYGLLGPLRAMKKLDRFEVDLPQECQVRVREDDPFHLQFHNPLECYR